LAQKSNDENQMLFMKKKQNLIKPKRNVKKLKVFEGSPAWWGAARKTSVRATA